MKIYLAFFFVGALYLTTGIFFSTVEIKSTSENDKSVVGGGDFYDYSGVLNVHSKKSSGGGSVQEIIAAGSSADLDFLFFNETNPVDQKQPRPIQFGDLHVFYGAELGYENSRFLYSSLESDAVFSSNVETQLFVSNYLETGGDDLMILAHPNKLGYEWEDVRPQFISGVEVLNLREIWRVAWRDKKLSFLSSLLFYPFNPSLFFLDIYSDEALSTEIWDDWGAIKKTSGYLGSDAKSKLRISSGFYLNFPGYKSIFSMARNHILLKEELQGFGDSERILKALKDGSLYFSIDVLGDPKGFAFWGVANNKKVVSMGDDLKLEAFSKFKVVLPKTKLDVQASLIRNGEVLEVYTSDFEFTPKETGVYRVEVRLNPFFPIFRNHKWVPWIFSNPIFLRGS